MPPGISLMSPSNFSIPSPLCPFKHCSYPHASLPSPHAAHLLTAPAANSSSSILFSAISEGREGEISERKLREKTDLAGNLSYSLSCPYPLHLFKIRELGREEGQQENEQSSCQRWWLLSAKLPPWIMGTTMSNW